MEWSNGPLMEVVNTNGHALFQWVNETIVEFANLEDSTLCFCQSSHIKTFSGVLDLESGVVQVHHHWFDVVFG
jgi:hypothetical protein